MGEISGAGQLLEEDGWCVRTSGRRNAPSVGREARDTNEFVACVEDSAALTFWMAVVVFREEDPPNSTGGVPDLLYQLDS
jgi:hypothetical protein